MCDNILSRDFSFCKKGAEERAVEKISQNLLTGDWWATWGNDLEDSIMYSVNDFTAFVQRHTPKTRIKYAGSLPNSSSSLRPQNPLLIVFQEEVKFQRQCRFISTGTKRFAKRKNVVTLIWDTTVHQLACSVAFRLLIFVSYSYLYGARGHELDDSL